MKKVLLATMIAAALTGCGTTNGFIEKKADWVQGSDNVDKALAPEWFTMHLANDGSHIFATATEYSGDYQFAIDKAMLAAKANLAEQVANRMKSSTKSFVGEEGNATEADDIDRKTERTTEAVVDTTLLVGYKRDKIEIRKEGRGYRVFVRLVYDYTDNNPLLQDLNRREKRKAKAEVKANKAPVVEVTPIPAQKLPHETISDAGVKKKVEDAIARGNAVIMSQTVQ